MGFSSTNLHFRCYLNLFVGTPDFNFFVKTFTLRKPKDALYMGQTITNNSTPNNSSAINHMSINSVDFRIGHIVFYIDHWGAFYLFTILCSPQSVKLISGDDKGRIMWLLERIQLQIGTRIRAGLIACFYLTIWKRIVILVLLRVYWKNLYFIFELIT